MMEKTQVELTTELNNAIAGFKAKKAKIEGRALQGEQFRRKQTAEVYSGFLEKNDPEVLKKRAKELNRPDHKGWAERNIRRFVR